MNIDESLNEIQLRRQDAERKLAWFEEERREIELSPLVREYLIVRDKKGFFGTAEGRARLDELGKTHEVRSWRRNSMNILRASEDVIAARKELMEYRKSHSSSQAPIPKLPRAAASDVYLPMTGVPSTKNSSESSSRGEIEIQPPQPQPSTAEFRQRRRAGNEDVS